MDYLERYRQGDHQPVWTDLQRLGPAVQDEPVRTQARAVASETMGRVRRNCERLIARLDTVGYAFGTYPDGSKRTPIIGPLTPSTGETQADIAELEATAGTLPLSLVAFWQHVGAVDLVGMHPDWGDGLDPLVVDPPEGVLAWILDSVEHGVEDETDVGAAGETRVFGALAPDDLHKDNVSGGDPYGLLLPDPSADFVFVNESQDLPFVSYLRHAVLDWGGFPGLTRRGGRPDFVEQLTVGLELF